MTLLSETFPGWVKTGPRASPLGPMHASIGLMPRKSLVLGPVDVPDHLFLDLVRGLLDGDGSILNFRYRGTGKANHERLYESLLAVFISASHRHLEWLRAGLARRLGIRGSLQRRRMKSGNYCSRLAYAKRESLILLPPPLRRPRRAAACAQVADLGGLPPAPFGASSRRHPELVMEPRPDTRAEPPGERCGAYEVIDEEHRPHAGEAPAEPQGKQHDER